MSASVGALPSSSPLVLIRRVAEADDDRLAAERPPLDLLADGDRVVDRVKER